MKTSSLLFFLCFMTLIDTAKGGIISSRPAMSLFDQLGVRQDLVIHYTDPTNLQIDEYGRTSLMRAIMHRDTTAVEVILAQTRYDLFGHPDRGGRTALDYAAIYGNARVVRHILAAPRSFAPDARAKSTAIRFALQYGNPDIAAMLRYR